MKRFIEFSLHEYMDEFPTQQVRIMEGDSLEAIEKVSKEYAKGMSEMYSGGPTKFVKVWDFKEANDWYIKNLKEMGDEDEFTEEEADWNSTVRSNLAVCYPKNKFFIGVIPY